MSGNRTFISKVKKEYEIRRGDLRYISEKECCCQSTYQVKSKLESVQDTDRKLFVGNLSWETSDYELRKHFGKYGEVESVNIKTNPNTGRSRGFAFIVFKTVDSIDRVLTVPDHIIQNKKTYPKKATARYGKVFVGGLPWELSDCDIRNYFSQYGDVVEVEIPYDPVKRRRMGFCFVTFDSEQPVSELLGTPKHVINGQEVDVKRYIRRINGSCNDNNSLGIGRFGKKAVESGSKHENCGNEAGSYGELGLSGNHANFNYGGTKIESGSRGGRGKASRFVGGKQKGSGKWQHQESRKSKMSLKVSVELDSY